MHVAFAFNKLTSRLQPTNSGISKAKLHAYSIRTRLKNSFNLKNHVFMGSTARQTSLKGYSDVDLLAVLPRDVLKWGNGWIGSDTFLRNVRNDLDERFHATDVRCDKQAIVIQFGGGAEPVDVVPGVFHEFKTAHKVPVFLIPDGNGGQCLKNLPCNASQKLNAGCIGRPLTGNGIGSFLEALLAPAAVSIPPPARLSVEVPPCAKAKILAFFSRVPPQLMRRLHSVAGSGTATEGRAQIPFYQ